MHHAFLLGDSPSTCELLTRHDRPPCITSSLARQHTKALARYGVHPVRLALTLTPTLTPALTLAPALALVLALALALTPTWVRPHPTQVRLMWLQRYYLVRRLLYMGYDTLMLEPYP